MFNRKIQRHLEWVFNLTLVALIVNTIFPINTGAAQTVSARANKLTSNHGQPSIRQLPVVPDKPVVVKKKLAVRSSAYSSTRDQTDNDPFTTASGTKVRDGVVAMNGLPFGTKIRLPEYFGEKVFTVEDRMHAKWGNKRVDIWMPSRQQAREWGVRTVTIEVL